MDSAADRAAAGATAGPSGGVSNKRPAQQQQQQQQPPPHITQASRRTKKNGRGGRRTNQQQSRSNGADANAAGAAGGAAANNNDDLVRVVPVPPDSVLLQEVRMGERKAEREREKEVKSFRLDRRHIFFVTKKKKKKKKRTGRLAPRPPLRHRPRPAGPRRPGDGHARLDERVLHRQGHPRRQRGDVVL